MYTHDHYSYPNRLTAFQQGTAKTLMPLCPSAPSIETTKGVKETCYNSAADKYLLLVYGILLLYGILFIFLLLYFNSSSSDDIQPSTVLSNQSPSG